MTTNTINLSGWKAIISSMCSHKWLYLNVSLIQHGTELLEKKCVTSLLDDVRNRWISFLTRFNEPNCLKRTGSMSRTVRKEPVQWAELSEKNRFNEPNCPKRTGSRKRIGLCITSLELYRVKWNLPTNQKLECCCFRVNYVILLQARLLLGNMDAHTHTHTHRV